MVKLALDRGADPQKIDWFSSPPSTRVSELLLGNPGKSLSSDMFLSLVVRVSCDKYNPTTQVSEISDKLIKQRGVLIKLALEKGADPNKIDRFSTLPSDELSKSLLDNTAKPLDPNKFLDLVLQAPCSDEQVEQRNQRVALGLGQPRADADRFLQIVVKQLLPIDEKSSLCLSTQKPGGLVELAIKRGADPSKIDDFSTLPSDEIRESLLGKMDPNTFLDLVLSCKTKDCDPAFLARRKELEDLAVSKGAMIDQVYAKYPGLAYAHSINAPFIGLNQGLLLKHLSKLTAATGNNLAEKFEKSPGHCLGLTTFWLYSKWLTFTHPEKTYGYNSDYFKQQTHAITSWDGKADLPPTELAAIQAFGLTIDYFQNPNDYISGISPTDIETPIIRNMLDTNGKNLKKKYSIASILTLQQLSDLLKECVHEDELVYVMHPGHATGLFKHEGIYYFYDPNNNKGERACSSIEETAIAILAANKNPHKNGLIGLIIYDFDDEEFSSRSYSYPPQRDLLTRIQQTSLDQDSLGACVGNAIVIGCLESLKFFLDQGLDLNKHGAELLGGVSTVNRPDILTELLHRGTGPNQPVLHGETYAEEQEHITERTCLQLSSKRGYVETVKVLLADPRTIPDQKDSAGKTALDYAATEEIKELIRVEMQRRQK